MTEKITVMLNEKLVKQLRELQTKKIKTSTSTVSFSRIINEVLEKGLKRI